jgi:hypothetical protein
MNLPHRSGSARAVRRATGTSITRRLGAAATLGLLTLALAAASADAAPPAAVKAKLSRDTLIVTGTSAGETIVLRLAASDPNTLEVDAGGNGTADFAFPRSKFTKIVVQGVGGPDTLRIDNATGAFTDTEQTRLEGGDGADTLLGGSGPEVLAGGAGADALDGGFSADQLLGDGDADTFNWDPGDSSDTIEGGNGVDRLEFNGANIGENFAASANGDRLRFTRDIASVVLDVDGVETLDVDSFGGADTLTVGVLSATDVTLVDADLATFGGVSDGQADTVVVQGTSADDTIPVGAVAGGAEATVGGVAIRVAGPEALDALRIDGLGGADTVRIDGSSGPDTVNVVANGSFAAVTGDLFGVVRVETADETLEVDGLGGADTIGAVGNLALVTSLVLDGGDAADTIGGGNGADVLIGGPGTDTLDGNQGVDAIDGSGDDDLIVWDPGDGNDVVQGGAGTDRGVVNGSNIGEIYAAIPAGDRVHLTRNIATVLLDLGTIERIDLATRGGADQVIVNDLSSTDLRLVVADLAAGGAGDAAADIVVVRGTSADDGFSVGEASGAIEVNASGGATTRVATLEAGSDIVHVDGQAGADVTEFNGSAGPDTISAFPNIDRAVVTGGPFGQHGIEVLSEIVRLNGLGGGDTLAGVGNLAAVTSLVLDGGDGNDYLVGANGADILLGGTDADTLEGNQGADDVSGGAGDDVVVWDPGDSNDTVDGDAGADTFAFRTASIGEVVDLGATAGGRLLISRNIATVGVDIGGIETVDVRVFGGGDTVAVNDLSSTEVDLVNVDLALVGGAGDGVSDNVVVLGSPNDETITLSTFDGGVQAAVPGGATTRVTGSEVAFDYFIVNGQGGTDVIDVVGPVATMIQLVLNDD